MTTLITRRTLIATGTAVTLISALPSPVSAAGAGTPTIAAFGGGRLDNSLARKMVKEAKRGGNRAVIVSFGASDPVRDGRADARWLASLGMRKTSIVGVDKAGRERPVRDLFLDADLIWFTGGYQKRHVLSLGGITGAVAALRAAHKAGAVIAGGSAGAAVMSKVMISGGKFPQVYTRAGFGLWPQVIVDQHVVARHREWRLQKAIAANPHLIGVGIDERAGVLYQNGEMTVYGRSRVILVRSVNGKIQETRLRRGSKVVL